jgi:hypothetical protein
MTGRTTTEVKKVKVNDDKNDEEINITPFRNYVT